MRLSSKIGFATTLILVGSMFGCSAEQGSDVGSENGSLSMGKVTNDESSSDPVSSFGDDTPAPAAEPTPPAAQEETPAAPAAEVCTAQTYGGRATVVGADVDLLDILPIHVRLGDSGALPAAGGYSEGELVRIAVPNLLDTGVAVAKVSGDENTSYASAELAGLTLNLLGIGISADVIEAEATALCGSASGASRIANLRINDVVVNVGGQPNQAIVVGPLSIIINEQKPVANGMEVNALHISALGIADVVLSSAKSTLECTCTSGEQPGTDAGTPGTDPSSSDSSSSSGSDVH